jgi:hypothetical protein
MKKLLTCIFVLSTFISHAQDLAVDSVKFTPNSVVLGSATTAINYLNVVDADSMHGVVLAAFKQSYGDIDHTNIDHVLSQLDHTTLMKMMKNERH